MRVWRSWQFGVALAVYAAGILLGVLTAQTSPGRAVAAHGGASFVSTAASLFANNLRTDLVVVACGMLTLGLFSVLVLGLNGIMLGAAWKAGAAKASLATVAVLTLPHGVPEVAGIVLSGYIGLRLATFVIDVLWRGTADEQGGLGRHLFVCACVVVALTLVAALIEAFVGLGVVAT